MSKPHINAFNVKFCLSSMRYLNSGDIYVYNSSLLAGSSHAHRNIVRGVLQHVSVLASKLTVRQSYCLLFKVDTAMRGMHAVYQ